MQLRPYQQQAVNSLRQAFTQGFKSPVLVLGCGGGKSVVAAHIAKSATDKGNRVLFVVHLKEILKQIRETFINYGVNMDLCDTAMVKQAHKLKNNYSIIITDESQHSICNTYKKIYDLHPNAIRVNVTATPCRSDGRGLGETCDTIIDTVSVKWLIENSYLAPYEYYSVTLDSFKFTDLKKKYGEYEDITELLDKPRIYGDIFKQYKQGSKVICYCSSIRHSITTANMFNSKGVAAAHIDGKTPEKERDEIIENFRNGTIKVLCNYGLIAEGFDVPDCDSVFILRKTTSLILFIQMAMRCMRYKPNKTAYIYDFCGNCYEHGLVDDDRVWSLDSKKTINKNLKSEPEILCRQCSKCFRVYAGTNRICEYCGNDNGKTKAEIKAEEKAELMRITELKKKQKQNELQKAITIKELQEYAKKYRFTNPKGWAETLFKNSDWRQEVVRQRNELAVYKRKFIEEKLKELENKYNEVVTNLFEYETTCKYCTEKEYCTGGMMCYGGEPIEPRCSGGGLNNIYKFIDLQDMAETECVGEIDDDEETKELFLFMEELKIIYNTYNNLKYKDIPKADETRLGVYAE